MNRILTIFLAVLYLGISSGVVVNTHYCMGEITGVSYKAAGENHCDSCGMDKSGCCHDDIKVIKLNDSQQTTAIAHYPIPPPDPVWLTPGVFSAFLPIASLKKDVIDDFPPLLHYPSIQILHCIFRI